MKTIEELYNEIVKDGKLQKEIRKAFEEGKIVEFAKAHGCNATQEQIIAFAKTKVADHPILSLFL